MMPRLIRVMVASCGWLSSGAAIAIDTLAHTTVQAEPTAIGHGLHGMAVFGGAQALYASHLPMFHAPHAAQVVFRFHLEASEYDAALRKRLVEKAELWTLVPTKRFNLQQLALDEDSALRRFRANLVQGHFERGGVTQIENVEIVIDSIILFQRLSLRPPHRVMEHYQIVGEGCERFVFKRIDRRPDFDLIAKLPTCAETGSEQLMLAKATLEAPTQAQWKTMLRNDEPPVLLYFETDDLR